jgi:hypothetical protein
MALRRLLYEYASWPLGPLKGELSSSRSLHLGMMSRREAELLRDEATKMGLNIE